MKSPLKIFVNGVEATSVKGEGVSWPTEPLERALVEGASELVGGPGAHLIIDRS
jgi:hypothetical protein